MASCRVKFRCSSIYYMVLFIVAAVGTFIYCGASGSALGEIVHNLKTNMVLYLSMLVTVDWLVVNMLAVRGGNIGHIRYVMKVRILKDFFFSSFDIANASFKRF